MQYRSLGRSGLKVSAVGLGANQFGNKVDLDTVQRILDGALDLGINLIDTADVYASGRSEEFIGKAIREKRERYVIATKVRHRNGDGPNDQGASRQHIMQGVEASLRRLQTDHIDVYQIHSWDETTPIEETLRALDDLLRMGKLRYIGASNFAAWQLCRANDLAEMHNWTSFVSVQPEYNMMEREIEKELIPYCKAFNIGILPYFPLAGGFLTGKYKRGEAAPKGTRGESSQYVQRRMANARNYTIIERLSEWAAVRDHTMSELAVAWLLAQAQIASVISGVTKVEQMQTNARAAEWTLNADDLQQIEQILSISD